MRVHVITDGNRHLHLRELEAFFRARHDIYVHEKRWRDPSASGLEIDQFDHQDATYLVGFSDDGELMGGTRLIPTNRPHLLGEVFAPYCDLAPVPRHPDVLEWTRAFVVPRFRRDRLKVVTHACAAVMQYCVEEGYTAVGGLQEVYWLPLWRKLDWSVDVIGSPREIAGDTCVVAYAEVSEAALAAAREKAGVERVDLIRRRTPLRPPVTPREVPRHIAA